MALVESVSVKIGTQMPDFSLKDPFGKLHEGRKLCGKKGLLIVFTCNHCPYAVAIWPRLVAFSSDAKNLGIETVGINPNMHPDYPEDAPERMKEKIKEWGIRFPYLIDDTQQTARDFKAQCTPDIYLYDASLKLIYHGRFDDNWKDETKVTRRDLEEAVKSLAQGTAINFKQIPSMGCSIKWR